MNREGLQESLSAVMDGEAEKMELRRIIVASDDASVGATWARYQLARAAMHGELINPHLDLVSSVSAVLTAEDMSVRKRRPLALVGQIAVAASVTLAVLVGVRFYAGASDEQSAAQLAERAPAEMQEKAILVGYTEDALPVEEKDQTSSVWLQFSDEKDSAGEQ